MAKNASAYLCPEDGTISPTSGKSEIGCRRYALYLQVHMFWFHVGNRYDFGDCCSKLIPSKTDFYSPNTRQVFIIRPPYNTTNLAAFQPTPNPPLMFCWFFR